MRCEIAKRLTATNKESATNSDATNKGQEELRGRGPVGMDRGESVVEVSGAGNSGTGKTKNRRSREAYNAYQREYMKKRRANHKEAT